MSRSGYSDGCDHLYLYHANVARTIEGKRGQQFLRDLLVALDAMPEKRLIAEELESHGEVCAIGALGRMRGIDISKINPDDTDRVARIFGISDLLAREVVFENDEAVGHASKETPEARWERMRCWVAMNILEPR